MAKPPKEPKQDQAFEKVVRRMLDTPPQPRKTDKKKPRSKKPRGK